MTKQNFYDFGMMMKKDSNILFDEGSLHNSVYLGAFVLEAYVKILLIEENQNYYGHINSGNFINRLQSIHPEVFDNSTLNISKLLSSEYDINYRYEVDKWIDPVFCQDIQDEIEQVKNALQKLRIDGVL